MFIKVRLLNGFKKELTYKLPESLCEQNNINNNCENNNTNKLNTSNHKTSSCSKTNLLNKIVRVPVKNKTLSAIVTAQFDKPNKTEQFEIREILGLEIYPQDEHYENFIENLSQYYQINKLHFLKRIKSFLTEKAFMQAQEICPEYLDDNETEKKPESNIRKNNKKNTQLNIDTKINASLENNIEQNNIEQNNETSCCSKKNISLTEEQKDVVDFLNKKILDRIYAPTLLHGVTGSGKTEVYKKLISTCINNNKSVLLLLPEVTLAIQFEKIMRQQLEENIFVCSFHSGTNIKDKKATWDLLIKNTPMLIIGVHVPVILPIPNLGLIIIDEEHESGYQEKKHPKINSKDAAIMKAHEANIPILLGSATPSITSLHNVKTKNWHFFQLKNRFSGNFPEVKTVFLSDKKIRRNFWISQELESAIRDRLAKKQQTIIFLNRRGYSFFVQCKDCSHIFSCPNCSVSLTLHGCSNKPDLKKPNHAPQIDNSNNNSNNNNKETLNCHYCDYKIQMPEICPECKKQEFLKKGIGTQQVVTILEKLFPDAKVARADMDTTAKKKLWQETMHDFESGKINILVGTQTISKGFHFPNVTLVGVLWADLNLHFPIFNATETTLQQLIQVAGRAGRNSENSLVIVQAMGQHKIFDYLNEIDYLKFYSSEIEKRELLGYPPYRRLVEIELKGPNEIILDREANSLAIKLINLYETKGVNADILGPAQPPVSKIKNTYIRKIYIKCNNISFVGALFKGLDLSRYSSQIFFTPNPLN